MEAELVLASASAVANGDWSRLAEFGRNRRWKPTRSGGKRRPRAQVSSFFFVHSGTFSLL
ncbi:hypothetical protein M5K25_002262 [Dendrobium thyrsiflorum]|uniref:Uncharacterized protein n=1 Tax=Dendrobium thyrsiflorum TaxID=117978 RepID=A0ABD0VS65_DENTH